MLHTARNSLDKDYDEEYSVYDFQIDSRKIIEKLQKENKNIILVGGTGLYVKACLYDYKFNKEEIKVNYDNLTDKELYNRIIKINKDIVVDKNNRRRLLRTLINLENDNISNNGNDLLYNNTHFIGLTVPRDMLYERINKRVDLMVKNGLLGEAKYFYNKNKDVKSLKTVIGYKELFRYFDNEISLNDAIDLIKKNSRHYAKRQYTFFNNKMNINWFNVDYDNFDNTVNEVINYIEKNI